MLLVIIYINNFHVVNVGSAVEQIARQQVARNTANFLDSQRHLRCSSRLRFLTQCILFRSVGKCFSRSLLKTALEDLFRDSRHIACTRVPPC